MFGIINLFKPIGPTSRDCVNHIQRIIRPCKVGHAGTLDPMADGVLLIGVGTAVRLVDWLHELPKSYEAVFEIGKTSLSGDNQIETEIVEGASSITQEAWLNVLPEFNGVIEQVPPIFSAVRVGGKRAYDLARDGQTVELASRKVTIHRLEVIGFDYPFVSMKIDCSTGTYIRSLGRDIARRLGSDAIMTKLTRTSIGRYRSDQSVSLDELESNADIEKTLTNPVDGLMHLMRTNLSETQLRDVVHGKTISVIDDSMTNGENSEEMLGLDSNGRLRSILRRRDDGTWAPHRNFLEGL